MKTMLFTRIHPLATQEHWGFIISFLNPADDAGAVEQINRNYISGWRPQEGFTFDKDTGALTYHDDPPMYPRSVIQFGDEMLVLYPYSFVMIAQKDGSWQVSRLD